MQFKVMYTGKLENSCIYNETIRDSTAEAHQSDITCLGYTFYLNMAWITVPGPGVEISPMLSSRTYSTGDVHLQYFLLLIHDVNIDVSPS